MTGVEERLRDLLKGMIVELTAEELDAPERAKTFMRSAIRDLVYARERLAELERATPPRGSVVPGAAEVLVSDPTAFDGLDLSSRAVVENIVEQRRARPEATTMPGEGESLDPRKA